MKVRFISLGVLYRLLAVRESLSESSFYIFSVGGTAGVLYRLLAVRESLVAKHRLVTVFPKSHEQTWSLMHTVLCRGASHQCSSLACMLYACSALQSYAQSVFQAAAGWPEGAAPGPHWPCDLHMCGPGSARIP